MLKTVFKILIHVFAIIGLYSLLNSCSDYQEEQILSKTKSPVVVIGLKQETEFEYGHVTIKDADNRIFTFSTMNNGSFAKSICASRKIGDTLY